jgi:hypothetical protein
LKFRPVAFNNSRSHHFVLFRAIQCQGGQIEVNMSVQDWSGDGDGHKPVNDRGLVLEDDRVYSPRETSLFLGRSTSTLAKDACRGVGLPFHRIGIKRVYSGKDIKAALKACRVEPCSATSDNEEN